MKKIEIPISIRPHHFLCLPGYKGHAYDAQHVNSWDIVSKLLQEYPSTEVKIVDGADTLCVKCPNNSAGEKKCTEKFIKALDFKVKRLLGLKVGAIYKYSEIIDELRILLDPKKHEELCGYCSWREKGFCKDTFEKVNKPVL